ncbi:MAG: hypothetical protein LBS44_06585 [Deltaproteobacteria bacterium]|jgi:hypothetical protein|nr:hypothetical protein [Deltaproteobacteria bacterium]
MKTTPGINKKQALILSELDKLAKKVGLKVSVGKLIFAGLKLKSGRCLLRQEDWLVVDRFQPFEEQADLYRRALAGFELSPQYLQALSPETRNILLPDLPSGQRSGQESG